MKNCRHYNFCKEFDIGNEKIVLLDDFGITCRYALTDNEYNVKYIRENKVFRDYQFDRKYIIVKGTKYYLT